MSGTFHAREDDYLQNAMSRASRRGGSMTQLRLVLAAIILLAFSSAAFTQSSEVMFV
jgi:hypothetical protein